MSEFGSGPEPHGFPGSKHGIDNSPGPPNRSQNDPDVDISMFPALDDEINSSLGFPKTSRFDHGSDNTTIPDTGFDIEGDYNFNDILATFPGSGPSTEAPTQLPDMTDFDFNSLLETFPDSKAGINTSLFDLPEMSSWNFDTDIGMDIPDTNIGGDGSDSLPEMGQSNFSTDSSTGFSQSNPGSDSSGQLPGLPQSDIDPHVTTSFSQFNLDMDASLRLPEMSMDLDVTPNLPYSYPGVDASSQQFPDFSGNNLDSELMTEHFNVKPKPYPTLRIAFMWQKLWRNYGKDAHKSNGTTAQRFLRNKLSLKVIQFCDVKTLMALRLVNRTMAHMVRDHLVSIGMEKSKLDYPEELVQSLSWRRFFRRKTLSYLCLGDRIDELTRVLVDFGFNHTGLRFMFTSQEEIKERISCGWRTNIGLRNIYRGKTRELRPDSNVNTAVDQPDEMENMKHLALSRSVKDLNPQKCFNFILARMHFENFVRFVLGNEHTNFFIQNHHWISWIFVHEGARFTEDVLHASGKDKIVNISPETRRQAEALFIERSAAMDAGLLATREAHAEELLMTMRFCVCRSGEQGLIQALREYHAFLAVAI